MTTLIKDVYGTPIMNYPSLLQCLYKINDSLKRDGILAPTNMSLSNTSLLYEIIGKPLDSIPTIHIGGTNGKVGYDL